MSSRKRKAVHVDEDDVNEDDEPPKKKVLSKAEQVAQAREAARKWSEGRQQKKTGASAAVSPKKQTPATASRKKPRLTKTTEEKNTEAASSTVESSSLKKSKKEALREARLQAAAWAKEQADKKAGRTSLGSSSATTTTAIATPARVVAASIATPASVARNSPPKKSKAKPTSTVSSPKRVIRKKAAPTPPVKQTFSPKPPPPANGNSHGNGTSSAAARFRQEARAVVPSSPAAVVVAPTREEEFNSLQRQNVPREDASSKMDPQQTMEKDDNYTSSSEDESSSGGFLSKIIKGLATAIGSAILLILGVAAVFWAIQVTVNVWGPQSQENDGLLKIDASNPADNTPGNPNKGITIAAPPCFMSTTFVPLTPEEKQQTKDNLELQAEDGISRKWWGSDTVPDALVEEGILKCVGRSIPCPLHGRCGGRYLRDCHNGPTVQVLVEDGSNQYTNISLFELSPNHDKCILNAKAQQWLNRVSETLVNLTVETKCSWMGHCDALPQGAVHSSSSIQPPMFDGSAIVDLLNPSNQNNVEEGEPTTIQPYDAHFTLQYLIALLPELEPGMLQTSSTTQQVGLSENFVKEKLPIPFSCWMWLLCWDLWGVFAGWVQSRVVDLVGLLWSLAVAYPMYFGALVCMVWGVSFVRRKRMERLELREQVQQVRELAYDKLIGCEDEGGYASPFLRDDVSFDLYPSSVKRRKYISTTVWPRVMAQVRLDSRVRKSHRPVDGVLLEQWEWIAPKQQNSRRGQLSIQ